MYYLFGIQVQKTSTFGEHVSPYFAKIICYDILHLKDPTVPKFVKTKKYILIDQLDKYYFKFIDDSKGFDFHEIQYSKKQLGLVARVYIAKIKRRKTL